MNRLLTPAEIAQLLGVKQSTIYQWTHMGFIPHIKLGGLLRFKEADIDRWLEKRSRLGRISKRQQVF